jgi:hypothetical protein
LFSQKSLASTASKYRPTVGTMGRLACLGVGDAMGAVVGKGV